MLLRSRRHFITSMLVASVARPEVVRADDNNIGSHNLASLKAAGPQQYASLLADVNASQAANDPEQFKQSMRVLTQTIKDGTAQSVSATGTATKKNKEAIASATKKQTNRVVANVSTRLTPILAQEQTISDTVKVSASSMNSVLTKMNEELYPLKNIGWRWMYELNSTNKRALEIKSSIATRMKKVNSRYFDLPLRVPSMTI